MVVMILGYVIGFLLFLFLLFIFWPLKYSGYYCYKGETGYELQFGYSFLNIGLKRHKGEKKTILRLLGFSLSPGKKKAKKRGPEKQKKEKKKKKKKKKAPGFSWRLLSRDDIAHILVFVQKLVVRLAPNSLWVNLRLGFSDPYYNGLCSALYQTLHHSLPGIRINCTTEWEEEVLEVEGEGKGRFIIAGLLYTIIRFFLSKRGISLLRKMRKQRKGRK